MKIGIGVLAVVLLVAGLLVYAFTNLNQLLEQNRDRLTALASESVGRPVSFSRAEVAFDSGLAVRLDDVTIAEDERFGSGDFLALDRAFVGVRIGPALAGRFEASGVRLESPTIHMIRESSGWNFSTIGRAEAGDSAGGGPGGTQTAAEEDAPLALAIAAFEIDAGTLVYEDRTSRPALAVTVEDLETSGVDLSLDGPLAIAFSGRLRKTADRAGAGPTSTIEGEVEIEDLATGAGSVRLESPSFYPSLLDIALEDDPKSDRLDGAELRLLLPSAAERAGYPFTFTSSAGRISGIDFAAGDVKGHFQSSDQSSDLAFERLAAELVGGKVSVKGKMRFAGPGRSPFAFETELADLDSDQLGQILLGLAPGMVSGRLAGNLDLAGDSLDWETLKQSLAGEIQLDLSGGALEKVNLLDVLVGRLVRDEGLGAFAAASIREAAPDALAGNRTEFESLGVLFEVASGALRTRNLELDAGKFAVNAEGLVGLDGKISANGVFRFSEEISERLVENNTLLSALVGSGGSVEVPLRLGGSTSAPRLRVDSQALAQRATGAIPRNAVNEIANILLGRRDGKGSSTGDAAGDGDAASDPEGADAPQDSTEELIRDGIGRLLGR